MPWWNPIRCAWWWPKWKVTSFLMLHSVSDAVVDPECPNNSIRPSELEGLIENLKARGYRFRTFKGAIEDELSGDARSARTVCMTFDDGYVDNYTDLFPVLRRHRAEATCFVTSRGGSDARFLSPAQIREMHASGLVEFGGHTATHCVLDRVEAARARDEIESNKRWLEDVVGERVVSFAYPCGGENGEIVEMVRSAGYRYGAAMVKKMRPVATDLMRVHRQIIPRGVMPWQAYLLATRGKFRI